MADEASLTNIRVLHSQKLLFLKFQVLLQLNDELLLTLPIALHEHDLLLHLRRVVIQLHVLYLHLGKLATELTDIVQQELYRVETEL